MLNFNLPRFEFVACHRMPERSFFYKHKQFPICARCTGMMLGYLTLPLFLFNIIELDLLSAFLLNIPALIDGYTQAMEIRESTNSLRLFTGLLSGFGQMALIGIIGKWIALYLLKFL